MELSYGSMKAHRILKNRINHIKWLAPAFADESPFSPVRKKNIPIVCSKSARYKSVTEQTETRLPIATWHSSTHRSRLTRRQKRPSTESAFSKPAWLFAYLNEMQPPNRFRLYASICFLTVRNASHQALPTSLRRFLS